MKIYLLAVSTALMLVGFLAACNQTNVDPSTNTLANARIAGVSNTSAVSGTCVRGNSETVIDASSLPAAVLTYLNTNYAGYTLVQAEQGTNQNGGATYYEVTFTYNGTTKELHFDMTGAVQTGDGHGHGHGKGGHGGGPGSGTATAGNSETVISQSQLPAAVGTYLSTNYAGYTFVQAEQGTDRNGATYYEVQFTYNGTTKELHFDANGNLLGR